MNAAELRHRDHAKRLATRLRQAAVALDRAHPDAATAHLDALEREIVQLEHARERRAA